MFPYFGGWVEEMGLSTELLISSVSAVDTEVLSTVIWGMFQMFCLWREQTKDVERVSIYWPKRKNEGVRGKILQNVGGGTEYRALEIAL